MMKYFTILYWMVRMPKSDLHGRCLTDRLSACALRPDLALLPNGDMTEVGEKGELPLQ